MSTPNAETLDQCLQDGEHSFIITIAAWLSHQTGEGPWYLRVSTQNEGETWAALKDANGEHKRLASTDFAGLAANWATKIKEAVVARHGPAPTCKLRIRAYEKGKSAEYEDGFRMDRSISALARGGGSTTGIDPTYHYTMVGQLHATAIAAHAAVRDVVGHLAALVAKQGEQNAMLATTRVVPTASADLGSSFTSLLGPLALVIAWPMIRQLVNDPRGTDFVGDIQATIKRLIAPDAKPLLPGDSEPVRAQDPPPKLIGAPPPMDATEPSPKREPAPVTDTPPNPAGLNLDAIREWAKKNPDGGKTLVLEALKQGGAPDYVIEFIRNSPLETP